MKRHHEYDANLIRRILFFIAGAAIVISIVAIWALA
jgi:hypothetical protein